MNVKLKHQFLKLFTCLFLLAFILLLRKPDAFLNPQLWAEDGAVFLVEQREDGSQALLNDYGGYYHLIPRLIALFSSVFPLDDIPVVYNYSAVLFILATGLLIHFSRVDLGVPKLLFALSLVLIQWFTAAIIPFLILQRPPESWKQGLLDAIEVFTIGMTGPFMLLATPLIIWRIVQSRKVHRYELPSCACVGLSILLQAHSLLINHPNTPERPLILNDLLHVCFLKFGSYLYFGKQLPESLPLLLSICAVIFLGVTFTAVCFLEKKQKQAIAVFLIFGMLTFFAGLFKASRSVDGDVLAFHPFLAGGRYYFLPFLSLFYTYLILSYSSQKLKLIGYVGVVSILLSSATAFTFPPLTDFNWKQNVQQLERQQEIIVPINPSWKIKLHAN
jgi:hypothetical protein